MTVHLGNIAEFNEQFEAGAPRSLLDEIREDCDVYACVAAFLTDSPLDVILARDTPDPRWWDFLTSRLRWDDLRIHTVAVGPQQTLSACAWEDPAVRAVLEQAPEVTAWGESPSYRQLASRLAPAAALLSDTYESFQFAESKCGGFEALQQVAMAHSHVSVPRSVIATTGAEVVAAIRELGGNGRRLVAKANHGVAGYGLWFIDPAVVQTTDEEVLERMAAESHRFGGFPILIQELVVARTAASADVTGDGLILADGRVRFEGAATMLVSGGHYGGAVTACESMVGRQLWDRIRAFTLDVGARLSDLGYRGWFDVDFLVGVDDILYALEINARRTGPVAAFTIASRTRQLGLGQAVACLDGSTLPERFDAKTVFDVFVDVDASLGRRLVPTSFLGLDATRPTLGLAAFGESGVDATALLRTAVDEIQRRLMSEMEVR